MNQENVKRDQPAYLFGAPNYDKLNVANSLREGDANCTVSVIDTVNNTVVRNIPVGVNPK
jgi:hypothetical protein